MYDINPVAERDTGELAAEINRTSVFYSALHNASYFLLMLTPPRYILLSKLTAMQSAQWYSWGPPNMQCRLCVSCWMYWKKYGGLKMPSRVEAPEERTSPSPASNVSLMRGDPAGNMPIEGI